MMIAVLIGAMVTIVVGVSLADAIPATGFLATVVHVLPFLVGAAIMLGGIAWITLHKDGPSKEEEKESKRRYLYSAAELYSGALVQYQNDLDKLLGIETRNDRYGVLSLEAFYTEPVLTINNEDYDWYLTAKVPNQTVFKVVGLAKNESSADHVYLLGNINNQPFLEELKDTQKELDHLDQIEEASAVQRVLGKAIAVTVGASLLPSIMKAQADCVNAATEPQDLSSVISTVPLIAMAGILAAVTKKISEN